MGYLTLLEEMFKEVTELKHSESIDKYYHPEFKLYANGIVQDYAKYLQEHRKLHATEIQYKVEIDRETMLESAYKAAMRVFITVSKPGDQPKKIEVVFIASFKDNKIYRLWETTSPDWSKMEYFKDYGK